MKANQFQQHILSWFDHAGRKDLPWQQNKTPYRVWVSEIMLQQTQVSTVLGYFERFMQTFPDIKQLARAPEDKVLHLWAGLGYYSRARNLHRAAKMVMKEFKGRLPDNLEALQSLPGIGASTAGAILAIAFNQQATILDGNVKRVLARFHGITEAINEKSVENVLWEFAKAYTPSKRVADYTQAMMDLGATVCVRGQPACERCPLVKACVAHKEKIAALLPRKKLGKTLPVRAATFLIFIKDKKIFLMKRPAKGIWGGLFCFPELEGKTDDKAIQAFCRKHYQLLVKKLSSLPGFRHSFTHYHLDILPVVIELGARQSLKSDMAIKAQIWYNPSEPSAIGMPKPVQLLLGKLP